MVRDKEETLLDFKEEIKQLIDEKLSSKLLEEHKIVSLEKPPKKTKDSGNELVIKSVAGDIDVYDELNNQLQPQEVGVKNFNSFRRKNGDMVLKLKDEMDFDATSLSDHRYILVKMGQIDETYKRNVIFTRSSRRIERFSRNMMEKLFTIEYLLVHARTKEELNEVILMMENNIMQQMWKDFRCQTQKGNRTPWWNVELDKLTRRKDDGSAPQTRPRVQEVGSMDVGMVIPEKGASQIKGLLKDLNNKGVDVIFSHVRGYTGNLGNERADWLAKQATNLQLALELIWNYTFQPVEITVETLQKYLDLEKEIHIFEKRHVLDNYQLKAEQLEQLEKQLQTLEENRNLQAQS
ncbi:hypothetical protein X975_17242, partial [Stegodyphus mimosarum]